MEKKQWFVSEKHVKLFSFTKEKEAKDFHAMNHGDLELIVGEDLITPASPL